MELQRMLDFVSTRLSALQRPVSKSGGSGGGFPTCAVETVVGKFSFVRVGGVVSVLVDGAGLSYSYDGIDDTLAPSGAIPEGFRPVVSLTSLGYATTSDALLEAIVTVSANGGITLRRIRLENGMIVGSMSGQILTFQFSNCYAAG